MLERLDHDVVSKEEDDEEFGYVFVCKYTLRSLSEIVRDEKEFVPDTHTQYRHRDAYLYSSMHYF